MLVLPTAPLAEAVAAEWQAQEAEIRPETMPFTRAANSATDHLPKAHTDVIGMLVDYGRADLLCYRAVGPAGLVARQAEGWDGPLCWVARKFDAPLTVTAGILSVPQPEESLGRLYDQVARLTLFELAGFHDLVTISGSMVLALAVLHEELPAEDAFRLSRIDEAWQAEQWGHDDEADRLDAAKQNDFLRASLFIRLCNEKT